MFATMAKVGTSYWKGRNVVAVLGQEIVLDLLGVHASFENLKR